jgi:hypothetical protein
MIIIKQHRALSTSNIDTAKKLEDKTRPYKELSGGVICHHDKRGNIFLSFTKKSFWD